MGCYWLRGWGTKASLCIVVQEEERFSGNGLYWQDKVKSKEFSNGRIKRLSNMGYGPFCCWFFFYLQEIFHIIRSAQTKMQICMNKKLLLDGKKSAALTGKLMVVAASECKKIFESGEVNIFKQFNGSSDIIWSIQTLL